MTSRLLLAVVVFIMLGVAQPPVAAQMGGMTAGSNLTPPVKGFYNGHRILFIHTEASDAGVADMLTKMMGPKVLVVPSLARIPATLLAAVYVFRNGIHGEGPFGFQPDVFDSAPGDPTYTPLREVTFVEWQLTATPRLLSSSEDIKRVHAAGQVVIRTPGIVVNMPILTWPGGTR